MISCRDLAALMLNASACALRASSAWGLSMRIDDILGRWRQGKTRTSAWCSDFALCPCMRIPPNVSTKGCGSRRRKGRTRGVRQTYGDDTQTIALGEQIEKEELRKYERQKQGKRALACRFQFIVHDRWRISVNVIWNLPPLPPTLHPVAGEAVVVAGEDAVGSVVEESV